ncbi:hypothetical protein ATANTOWER_027270 [Ataeniobius toweri]|uniref:Uncharacterized protein n=1 Tax=Ataeniobius toweri TaxID=208326 RepID=A0ABU7C3T3_9TELE|nr:hypothetical protein [Ataeniobius toweri]
MLCSPGPDAPHGYTILTRDAAQVKLDTVGQHGVIYKCLKSGWVQIGRHILDLCSILKYLKDRDKGKYSMISGKKIKMKVKKSKKDKQRDKNRAELLDFLNSTL